MLIWVVADCTYFINRLFATIEYISKVVIPVGFVGVVVSYTGSKDEGFSGIDYKRGELKTLIQLIQERNEI